MLLAEYENDRLFREGRSSRDDADRRRSTGQALRATSAIVPKREYLRPTRRPDRRPSDNRRRPRGNGAGVAVGEAEMRR